MTEKEYAKIIDGMITKQFRALARDLDEPWKLDDSWKLDDPRDLDLSPEQYGDVVEGCIADIEARLKSDPQFKDACICHLADELLEKWIDTKYKALKEPEAAASSAN
jgi:hypothetical protein